jgi:flagellar biosynthetic protein FliR
MIEYEVALDQFEIFLLILMRMASFVYAAPFFNTTGVLQKTKVGFSFMLSVLVYSMNMDIVVSYNGVIEYAVLVVKEVAVGILLGAVTSFCVQIIMMSGKIIDMDTGISMAQIYDPTTKLQVGIMGNLYYYLLLLMLIVSGLYRYLVSAIVETYNAVPIGQVKFSTTIYTDILKFLAEYFVIGFRIALPVFAVMLLVNCVLAILAKVAPQMNMFVVGIQLKLCIGIIVIYFTIVMLPAVSNFIYEEIVQMFASLVRGMS